MNSYQFRLFFDGLCAFADRDNVVEAYVLYGHGDHRGTLTIRADFVNTTETTWHPMTVGAIHESDGAGGWIPRQVGIWSLQGEEVTVADTFGNGRPSWRNRDRLIDFSVEHPGSSTFPKATIRRMESRVGIVNLIGGGSSLAPADHTSNDRFALKKRTALHNTRLCARSATWISSAKHVPTIANRAGDVIVLREAVSTDVDAWACVSNVAPISHPLGLKHFHHFYEGVQLAAGDSPITIENAFIPEWECVPVIAWPPEAK